MAMDLQVDTQTTENLAHNIAFVTGEQHQFKQLSRILRRAIGDVIVADSLTQLADNAGLNLITVSYDDLCDSEKQNLMASFQNQQNHPALILLSAGDAQQDIAKLFGSRALTNLLIFNNADVNVLDVLVTIQKILLKDIFGLEKYFTWGIQPFSHTLTNSEQRHDVLKTLDNYATNIGIPRRLRSVIHSAADEFITNAIYNAPVDENGKSRFSHRSRTDFVQLDPGEEIEFRFCCDGRRFGMSAIDPFGSLTPKRLSNYLAKCFRKGEDQLDQSSGGAGLGFYHIYDALSHFIVNIRPGDSTEVIGLIDVSGGYRNFVQSGKSFNIFVSE